MNKTSIFFLKIVEMQIKEFFEDERETNSHHNKNPNKRLKLNKTFKNDYELE
ncbi:MAG: hypothetical protein REH79_03790 [Spiroplasma sp.]|nr:hypothetical protein [Spiroplasma sp.]